MLHLNDRQHLSAWNDSQSTHLANRLEWANSPLLRARGLLGRSTLREESGMLFVSPPCLPMMWLHTFGMRFTIDVLFLDGRCGVMRIDHGLQPWRLSSLVFGARLALELPAGTARQSGTQVGDHILIRKAHQHRN